MFTRHINTSLYPENELCVRFALYLPTYTTTKDIMMVMDDLDSHIMLDEFASLEH